MKQVCRVADQIPFLFIGKVALDGTGWIKLAKNLQAARMRPTAQSLPNRYEVRELSAGVIVRFQLTDHIFEVRYASRVSLMMSSSPNPDAPLSIQCPRKQVSAIERSRGKADASIYRQ